MRVQTAARLYRPFLLAVAAISLVVTAPAAQQRQCPNPVDNAPNAASLDCFREDLIAAVNARDLAAFRSLVASDVVIADDERGFAALAEVYELTDPLSVYWTDLEHALSLGGVLEPDGTYCAPIVSCLGASRWRAEEPALGDEPVMSLRIAHRGSRWLLVELSGD